MNKLFLFPFLFLSLLMKAQNAGDVAQNFGSSLGFDYYIRPIVQQPDGKILVGGGFTTYNGATENHIIRLNSNGTKDTALNTGAGFNDSVLSIVLQPDGKILVGGAFTTYNGAAEKFIIRLNADGTKDTSFNTGTGFNSSVQSIALQPDGKILIGGSFITYKGVTENRLIRLNSDGTKDTSFNIGTGFGHNVLCIALQPDGKILVGGYFSAYNGATEKYIIRLNSDGTKDTSFNTGTGFNDYVFSIALQPDDKILLGGTFTTYNGATENRVIRLNSDGTKDTSFNTGAGFNAYVISIIPQTEGKILLGGNFTTYKGVTENYIIRLNSDGTKDASFNTGTGFNSYVNVIALQNDGKLLVGGNFTTYKGGNESAYLIALHATSSLSNESFTNAKDFSLHPNPVKDFLTVDLSDTTAFSTAKIYDLQGKLLLEKTNKTIDVSSLTAGLYFIKILTEKGESTKKFIKE